MYILGIDISKWQDDNSTPQMMDFNKAKNAGAKFVLIKTSQATWLDQDYTMNWQNAKLAGIPRGGYHYMDWTVSAIKQARFFAGVLEKDMGELEPVLDFECRTNVPIKPVACKAVYDFVNEFENITEVKPTIYTSPSFWIEFGSTNIYWREYKLWIANYYKSFPTIPPPWNKWYMWQFTDRGDGELYGAESTFIDLDYFNNIDYKFPGDTIIVPPPIEPNEFPYNISTTASYLNIRTEPIVSSITKIGAVPMNTKFEVIGKENDWYKAIAYLSSKYAKRID
jgi:GH25 family lysozyme M1 (1,4-beta-N-acetylmuramidase)